jgi:uncharacterized protein YgbK (DUF1537 family)
MVNALLPGNRAECVALISSVNGNIDELTAEQIAAVRQHFSLDDKRTVGERVSAITSDEEISAFVQEVNRRHCTSPWLLTRARSLYRASDNAHKMQILDALKSLARNSWVFAFVTDPPRMHSFIFFLSLSWFYLDILG